MQEEKFVLRKERNFIKTIVFMWFILFLLVLLMYYSGKRPTDNLMDGIIASFIGIIIAGSLMWWAIRPLTPLTMIIDWDKELLFLSDREEESITARFSEMKWIVYNDLYRRRGISLKLLNGNFYTFGVTVNSKDKERLLQAIARINEIIEKKKRLQPSEKVK